MAKEHPMPISVTPHPDQIKAGQIVGSTLKLARGLCECPIDAEALNWHLEEHIRREGGTPALKGYQPPFTDLVYQHGVCLSLNNEAVHGPPRPRQVRPSDVITVDLVVRVGEWHADGARTFTYSPNEKDRKFVGNCHRIFKAATGMITPNMPVNSFGRIVEQLAGGLGIEIVREFCGHGISTEIHHDPQVYNFDNMAFGNFEIGKSYAVEPILAAEPYNLTYHPDGWTVEADCLTTHFEDTLFISDKCIIRLTEEPT